MNKIQALEAFKVSIVLKGVSNLVASLSLTRVLVLLLQMNEKLDYLDRLKNNMGEEMAEMMSEEITKVMDEQKLIEQRYARLITERGELKGISNKHKLHETKA